MLNFTLELLSMQLGEGDMVLANRCCHETGKHLYVMKLTEDGTVTVIFKGNVNKSIEAFLTEIHPSRQERKLCM